MTDPLFESVKAEQVFDQPDAESVVDLRMLRVVEEYAALAGVEIQRLEPHLLELMLPAAEAQFFRGRRSVKIALSIAALERSRDAEMAVVGSAFLQDLLDAVRSRGFRVRYGLIPPTLAPSSEHAELTVPCDGASAGVPNVALSLHSVGSLIARVSVKSGASGEEQIVESGVFDLSQGMALASDLVDLCEQVRSATLLPAEPGMGATARSLALRSMDELLPLMFDDLHATLRETLEQRRAEAERALAAEVARLDRYYDDFRRESAEADADLSLHDQRAIELERDRRKAEEKRRYDVRVSVQPLQLREFDLLVQQAEWTLTTPSGFKGAFSGQRALSGTGGWTIRCPTCGAEPRTLRVCRQNHVTCSDCSERCSVCQDAFCERHGIAECHVDHAPACSAHARRCPACRKAHCTAHEGECDEGHHRACTACLAACAVCGRTVCTNHGVQTTAESPRGARRLCSNCVVYCEGGTNEPVGRDEVVRCASCERFVCTRHQATCAVDGLVHCSKHLRRADKSRRLTCEQHRAQCGHEPHVIFASDEVAACATCGTATCAEHGGVCSGDRLRHCKKHLARLLDTPDEWGCDKHRTVCHVDARTYSVSGTSPCPACGRATCSGHSRPCGWCGRAICATELPKGEARCGTCRQLADVADPSDALITAAVLANGGEPPKVKTWKVARDATHQVAELDLGWSRRLVFAVHHGLSEPETVMRHSLLGTSRER